MSRSSRVALGHHLAILALFCGLVALYTWPLVLDPAHLLPNHHDSRIFTWIMLTVFRNLLTRPWALFHGNAFYPMGSSLTYSEPLLTPAFVAGPLFALTGNPILAYNLTLLGFWALSGWAMYAVTYWLTRHQPGAFIAAVIFTLSPYRTDYYSEFQMQLAFGIPLAVYCLVRFLEGQRLRHLAGLLAIFWLQAVAVWYYAVILGLGLGVVALQYVALRWRGWRARTILATALGGVMLALALAPVAWPFFQTRQELGLERSLKEAEIHSADVLTYFETGPTRLYRFAPTGHVAETSLFLGFGALTLTTLSLGWLPRQEDSAGPAERLLAVGVLACLALAVLALATPGRIHVGPVRATLPIFSIVGVVLLGLALARHAAEGWRRWRQGVRERQLTARDWVILLLGLAVVAFLLSLGPVVHLGRRALGPGLSAWLYPWLLPLHAIRVTTRFGVLVVFAGALLAAFGIKWLAERLPQRISLPVASGFLLLLLLEYASFPLPYGRVEWKERAAVYRWLAEQSGDFAVVEVPMDIQNRDAQWMLLATAHRKRLVNGFSGFVPEYSRRLSALLSEPPASFPSAELLRELRGVYPLRYVIVHHALLSPEEQTKWRRLAERPPAGIRRVVRFGTDEIFAIDLAAEQRGRQLERSFAYDYLRAHPVARFELAAGNPEPGRRDQVELVFNGRRLGLLALGAERAPFRFQLPSPYQRVDRNRLEFRYRYELTAPTRPDPRYEIGDTGVVSPVDLYVVSAGKPHGWVSSIVVNGEELSPDRRGYNLVALDPKTGALLGRESFDTFLEREASARLAAFIDQLAPGTIVVAAVKDEAAGQLTEEAVAALRRIGAQEDLRGRLFASHLVVGVQGARPGTAVEAAGQRRVEAVIGRDPRRGEMLLRKFALLAEGEAERGSVGPAD